MGFTGGTSQISDLSCVFNLRLLDNFLCFDPLVIRLWSVSGPQPVMDLPLSRASSPISTIEDNSSIQSSYASSSGHTMSWLEDQLSLQVENLIVGGLLLMDQLWTTNGLIYRPLALMILMATLFLYLRFHKTQGIYRSEQQLFMLKG